MSRSNENILDTSTLKKAWLTIHENSCPYNYNFHLHTIFSDGRMSPYGLIQQAVRIGMTGLAITDHHTVDGYLDIQQSLPKLRHQNGGKTLPYIWTGVEITAKLLDTEVHILGYGFDIESPYLQPYLQGSTLRDSRAKADKVIKSIQQAGGLAVLAHPARYRLPARTLIPAAAKLGIDGVETYYAYSNSKPWQPSATQTKEVKQLAAKYNLYSTCGTDSHGLSLLQRI
ncbi:PHP domain-containing protein [Myxosarcina sp. GI1]|uniref:PHP domain-containing protein n=1 Tax=Myxosarcina sp. GI1 TaxID=1541065 RepID=UPI0020A0AC8D|nr:PHP domain-containing protein [Myxosarcina sp. GI1]